MSRRRGLGALALILMVLIALVPLASMLMSRGRGLTALLGHEERDEEAAWLLGVALQEAAFRVRMGAQTPGDPLYTWFREAAPGASLGLEPALLPNTADELDDAPQYRLEGPVQLSIRRQGYLTVDPELATPYDLHGVLRLEAALVNDRGGRTVASRDYGYRRVLVAPPRPFDRATFLLVEATPLVELDAPLGDGNAMIRFGIEKIPAWKRQLRKERGEVREMMKQAGRPRLKRALIRILKAYRAARQAIEAQGPDWREVELGGPEDEGPRSLHLFPERLLVYSAEAQVNLARVDLPTRLAGPKADFEAAAQRVQQGFDQRSQKMGELMAKLRANQYGGLRTLLKDLEVANAAYLAAVVEYLGTVHRILEVYHDFQTAVVEVGGAAAAEVDRQMDRASVDELRQRAHFVFQGPQAVDRFQAFVADHPQGVAFVDTGDRPLELDLTGLEGRLTVVASGSMVVKNATVADPARDALTLVARTRIRLDGPVTAAVLVTEGGAETRGEDRIGSLVLDSVEGAPAAALKGVLTRQDGLVTSDDGAAGERLPPRPETLRVEIDPFPGDWRTGR